MGGYRTSINPQYEPGARIDIEQRGTQCVLVQRHLQSPHPVVWESEPYPSPDAARRRELELRAMEATRELRSPLSVCSNFSHLAFYYHWHRVSEGDHPSVALGDCQECYDDVEKYVRAAAEELEWIREVYNG